MRRFYFHLQADDQIVPDDEGVDLPDLSAAEHEAILAARELFWRVCRARAGGFDLPSHCRPRERGQDQKSTSAVDALDVFATLSHLFVNFGGNIPEFLNHRAVWFRSQIGAVPASLTSPSRDVIEPAKNYWLDMAALATELEKMLIKHADGHHNSPDFAATGTT